MALYRTGMGDKEGYVTYQFLQGQTAGTLTFTARQRAINNRYEYLSYPFDSFHFNDRTS